MIYISFFRFKSLGYNTTFSASPDIFENAIKEGRNDYDRQCYKLLLTGKYDCFHFPIVYRQQDGKTFRDFLDTGWPPVYLVSDRIITLLNENRITGWQSYPIVLYDKKGNLIEGYSGFSVIGKGGNYSMAWERGFDKEKKKHFIESRGLYDLSQWDGSDFFLVSDEILITERTMKLLKQNKVSAVEYENLSLLVDYTNIPRI